MEEGAVREAVANKAVEGLRRRGTTMLWRGILTILFGLAALFWPDTSLRVLIYIVGAFLIFDGIVSTIIALQAGVLRDYLVQIAISIIAGIAIFTWPQATGKVLLVILGIWAIVQGLTLFMAGRELKKEYDEGGLLTFVGSVLLVFGIAAFFWQNVAVTAIAWIIGLAAIAVGALKIFLATRLRALPDKLAESRSEA